MCQHVYTPLAKVKKGKGYHKSHSSNLHGDRANDYQREKTPTGFAQSFATGENDKVDEHGDGHQHNPKSHEEANAAPHGAEIPVLAIAVFILGKWFAGIGQGRAAAVEAEGVVEGRLIQLVF
jgi:hypothetical protein